METCCHFQLWTLWTVLAESRSCLNMQVTSHIRSVMSSSAVMHGTVKHTTSCRVVQKLYQVSKWMFIITIIKREQCIKAGTSKDSININCKGNYSNVQRHWGRMNFYYWPLSVKMVPNISQGGVATLLRSVVLLYSLKSLFWYNSQQ